MKRFIWILLILSLAFVLVSCGGGGGGGGAVAAPPASSSGSTESGSAGSTTVSVGRSNSSNNTNVGTNTTYRSYYGYISANTNLSTFDWDSNIHLFSVIENTPINTVSRTCSYTVDELASAVSYEDSIYEMYICPKALGAMNLCFEDNYYASFHYDVTEITINTEQYYAYYRILNNIPAGYSKTVSFKYYQSGSMRETTAIVSIGEGSSNSSGTNTRYRSYFGLIDANIEIETFDWNNNLHLLTVLENTPLNTVPRTCSYTIGEEISALADEDGVWDMYICPKALGQMNKYFTTGPFSNAYNDIAGTYNVAEININGEQYYAYYRLIAGLPVCYSYSVSYKYYQPGSMMETIARVSIGEGSSNSGGTNTAYKSYFGLIDSNIEIESFDWNNNLNLLTVLENTPENTVPRSCSYTVGERISTLAIEDGVWDIYICPKVLGRMNKYYITDPNCNFYSDIAGAYDEAEININGEQYYAYYRFIAGLPVGYSYGISFKYQ